MTGPERDSDVDAWLQARRTLLRNADDALSLEPPPELDQRVIDRARRELRAAELEKPRFFRSSRFAMPFAIAATVVLSFSLVLEFNRYESGRDALRTHAESSSAAAITLTPPQPATADLAQPTATAANTSVAAASAPAPAPLASAPLAEPKQERPERRRQDALGESADAAMVAREVAQPVGAAAAGALADKDDRQPMAAAMPPPAAPPAMTATTASETLAADRPASTRAAAKSAPGAANASATRATEWWKVIEQLRLAGRNSEAEAEYKAFRKAYPDFVVPAEQAQPPQ